MNELIKVEVNENNEQVVRGRELYKFLGISERYSSWFERMLQYGFTENKDYIGCKTFNTLAKQELQDHLLKIPMAKEISMLQRNEKGKQAREYFIGCEEAWNSPEMVLIRADQIKSRMIENYKKELEDLRLTNKVQKQQIIELQPKALYYDLILQCKDLLSTTVIAKDYGMSASALNDLLHKYGVQYKQSNVWFLYQKYAVFGYTQTKTNTFSRTDGTIDGKPHMYWTQKGRIFLYEFLKEKGIVPLIERENEKKEGA